MATAYPGLSFVSPEFSGGALSGGFSGGGLGQMFDPTATAAAGILAAPQNLPSFGGGALLGSGLMSSIPAATGSAPAVGDWIGDAAKARAQAQATQKAQSETAAAQNIASSKNNAFLSGGGPSTNLSDSDWSTLKQMRDELGWDNPYDAAMRQIAGEGLLSVLSGSPIGLGFLAYRSQNKVADANRFLQAYKENLAMAAMHDPNAVIVETIDPSSGQRIQDQPSPAPAVVDDGYYRPDNGLDYYDVMPSLMESVAPAPLPAPVPVPVEAPRLYWEPSEDRISFEGPTSWQQSWTNRFHETAAGGGDN